MEINKIDGKADITGGCRISGSSGRGITAKVLKGIGLSPYIYLGFACDQSQKIKDDILKSKEKIRQAVEELEISEDEISKLSHKIQSMVKRIDETYKFFKEIEQIYSKDIKELKHFARKVEKDEDIDQSHPDYFLFSCRKCIENRNYLLIK